jgi:hypothetical protein
VIVKRSYGTGPPRFARQDQVLFYFGGVSFVSIKGESKYNNQVVNGWRVLQLNGKNFLMKSVQSRVTKSVSNASITNGRLAVGKVPLENHEDDGSWDQLVDQVEF